MGGKVGSLFSIGGIGGGRDSVGGGRDSFGGGGGSISGGRDSFGGGGGSTGGGRDSIGGGRESPFGLGLVGNDGGCGGSTLSGVFIGGLGGKENAGFSVGDVGWPPECLVEEESPANTGRNLLTIALTDTLSRDPDESFGGDLAALFCTGEGGGLGWCLGGRPGLKTFGFSGRSLTGGLGLF